MIGRRRARVRLVALVLGPAVLVGAGLAHELVDRAPTTSTADAAASSAAARPWISATTSATTTATVPEPAPAPAGSATPSAGSSAQRPAASSSPAASGSSAPKSAGARTTSTTVPATTVQYAASDDVLANPERGFTHYTETRWAADGSGYTPLDAAQLTTWRTTEAVTVVYRVFYLEGLADQDTIDPVFLSRVAADLGTARAAGVKLVVRFAYSPDDGHDAPPARAVGQIRQLAPLLDAARDVVLVVQAGFVGRWGEWYYSDSYTADPSRPWSLSDADWAARGQVLDALLDALDPAIDLQVRYPAIVTRLLDGDPRAARVGVHDDCFLASDTDMGTYASAADRSWLAGHSRTTPVGGETCGVNAPRSNWATAATELARYHWSFLNADFDRDVLTSWGTDGQRLAAQRLGYRFRLVSSTLPGSGRAGGTVPVQLRLTNDGWASALRDRPVRLVLTGPGGTTQTDVRLDLRTLGPGTTTTVTASLRLPDVPGSWQLALALPDPDPALAAQPAYAVQLADAGLWDPVTGLNDLRRTLTVTP